MDNRPETAGRAAGPDQDVVLRRERPEDHAAVEQLQRVAFDDPDDLPSLVAALAYEPWMTGTLVYSEVFWALDCVGLRADHD